jgi:predicted metal-dependent HD superfamily phosphohydrolase
VPRGGARLDGVSADEQRLRAAWARCAGDSPEAQWLLESLLARHREPHRHYHGIAHVAWVVRHVEQLARSEPVDDLDAVIAAAFFHDAVYDPTATDNEPASARLAERELAELGWAPQRCRAVAAMVEATAEHLGPGDRDTDHDTAVLLDADLAVLGSEPAAYQAYAAGVRAEYAHVAPEEWRAGRRRVLQALVDRDPLYATATARELWEARARANIAAEVASLTGRT